MAKELTLATIDKLHSGLERKYPNLDLDFEEINSYYEAGDFYEFIFDLKTITLKQADENIFTLSLLILAAEDELEGYLL